MVPEHMSLTTKIFTAIVLTGALIVTTMAVLLAVNMRQGFALYLVQGELNRFDDLERALARAYEPTTPGWPQFATRPLVWDRFVKDNFEPAVSAPRRDRDRENDRPPPDRLGGMPGTGDPLQIKQRLSLLDADGRLVAGNHGSGEIVLKRPVFRLDGDATSEPIGWIGLSAPQGGQDSTDAFFLRGQYTSLLFASLAAIALSAIAAFLLARQFLAPIKKLANGARTLATGNYAARIENTRHDELGDLIEHYNALASSLETAEAAQRQWISDTSHELQTPLAILRAEVEAIQDGVRTANAATMGEMHSAVMRLSRLVGDLRTLSFNDEGRFVSMVHQVNLAEIVDDVVSSHSGRIAGAGLQISCQADATPVVAGDPMRLRQVFDNLLENALRYTAAPGEIRVRVSREDGRAVVTIDDTPPSPPAEAMPHLFERFFRADTSRSREYGGSGLGLAICEAIIKAHAGTITAATSTLGGLQIRIVLPDEGGEHE